jgi:hypothetical protein
METIEDVERLVASGSYQFWAGRDSAAITEMFSSPQRKVLVVKHGGGNLDELWNEMEPQMCAFAAAHGCTSIMGEGRMGWKRVTEKRGYRLAWISMIKDLSIG